MHRLNVLLLACLALLALASASHHKDSLTKWNRTPKEANLYSNACDECQIIIKRIAEIAKDPSKLGELKMLLNLLCRETSYEEECHLFVSNIDRFLEKLLPYLQDAHAACQKLHICGSTKLEQFHRVAMLYAKKYLNKVDGARDLICEECQFAAHEMQTLVEDKQYQAEIKQFLSENVCAHLGQLQGSCEEGLELFLPDIFQELDEMLKDNKQFCEKIELCTPTAAIAEDSSAQGSAEETNELSEGRKVSKRVIHHFLKKNN